MINHDITERQMRMDTELRKDRDGVNEFRLEVRERFEKQDVMLQALMDDLKLRRWILRVMKFIISIGVTIVGVTHGPDWLRHILGLKDINK